MLAVADIIRLHGAAYRAHVGDRLLPSQARVLRDLAACRTAYFGGQLTQCHHCDQQVVRYHSCAIATARRVTVRTPSAGSRRSAASSCCARTIS
jgi:hypothetical protein